MKSQDPPVRSRRLLRWLLELRIWASTISRHSELQLTLIWAGLVGFVGAMSSILFRELTDWVHWWITGQSGGQVESFIALTTPERLAIPAAGGLIAGSILHFGTRLRLAKSSTDYMEAVVVGDGVVSSRSSLVKCSSALFSIASGASIGREGPLVQLSAMLASLLGRMRRWPTTRLRLLAACGASAGIASAYNAPIAGALFVAEILLGSVAMETFGPLVFSSVVATLTVRGILGSDPLYKIPAFGLHSAWEFVPCFILGLLSGTIAAWFLRFLRLSEGAFSKLRVPLFLKLGFGGLIVGALAVYEPAVCGNGYSVVKAILGGDWIWQTLLMILTFKILATGATFGSGAVGGVFTPTLSVGASIGYVFGTAVALALPGLPISINSYALVGMGSFLAATTRAPIMAIMMVFELTLDYEIILPLMLASVVAYYIAMSLEKRSLYSEPLERKGATLFNLQLSRLRVSDLMKPDPPSVEQTAQFSEIAQSFIRHRFEYLYVVDAAKQFLGAISLHDIKSFLHRPDLAAVVIAGDIVRDPFPTVTWDASVSDALERFVKHDSEHLPVVSSSKDNRLVGSVSKTDLLLALAERSKGTNAST